MNVFIKVTKNLWFFSINPTHLTIIFFNTRQNTLPDKNLSYTSLKFQIKGLSSSNLRQGSVVRPQHSDPCVAVSKVARRKRGVVCPPFSNRDLVKNWWRSQILLTIIPSCCMPVVLLSKCASPYSKGLARNNSATQLGHTRQSVYVVAFLYIVLLLISLPICVLQVIAPTFIMTQTVTGGPGVASATKTPCGWKQTASWHAKCVTTLEVRQRQQVN